MMENIKKIEMDEDMMALVNGGMKVTHPLRTPKSSKEVYLIHDGCGGIIDNPIYWYATCTRCGEEHFFLSDFNYHTGSAADN